MSKSAAARNSLISYLSGEAKFKQRGVIMEIAPSGSDISGAAQVKTTVERFGDVEAKDS